MDTNEVIEGNSRLAVYKLLRDGAAEGDWGYIPCHIISTLTERQQAAYLNQVHVKGKAQWSAYEKANFAYARRVGGWGPEEIAELFGESRPTIRTRISVIELMKDSEDQDRTHFSHYNVLVRTPAIWQEVRKADAFRDRVIGEIKALKAVSEDTEDITAQDLRNKLPVIIKKPKVLRRYTAGEIELKEAYDRAKVSRAEERAKQALALLEEVSRRDVADLDQNSVNSLKQAVRKLTRAVERIRGMVARGGGK